MDASTEQGFNDGDLGLGDDDFDVGLLLEHLGESIEQRNDEGETGDKGGSGDNNIF